MKKRKLPQRLAIDHLDRLRGGVEILQQPRIHLHLELTGYRSLRLAVPAASGDHVPQPHIAQ